MKAFALTIIFTSIFFVSGCKIFPSILKNMSLPTLMLQVQLLILPIHFLQLKQGTLRLRSEEVWYRRDFSGNKTTFLWGLFTFTDY